MTSGELNRKITLKSPVTTQNDEGELEVDGYDVQFSAMAKVEQTKPFRISDPSALLHTNDFTIRTENRILTMDWVLDYEGEEYTINGILREPVWTVITAKLRNNG